MGFVVKKGARGQIFSKFFGFPCQFSFHLLPQAHYHLSSTIGKRVADVPNELSFIQHQETKKLKFLQQFQKLCFL
jgi:hypothetical protein